MAKGIAVSKKRVAILISGRGSNMEALIAAAAQESYPAQIALVISNRPGAPGLRRAAAAGIATEIVDPTLHGNDRERFFKGLDTHARALAAGVKIHGATVHMVVPEVDGGPILAQAAVPVREGDAADTLAARVLEAEHRIYPAALKFLAEGRVRVIDGRCRIDGLADADGLLFVPNI